jgi:cytochrome c5
MKKRTLSLVVVLGLLVSFSIVSLSEAAAARTGKQVYETACKACHATGISGAPKYGDKGWIQLEKKEGLKELTKDAIKGVRAMPPRGGCADCSDKEVRAAVKYLVDSAKK